MPVYNAERYVADAISSILAQTYPCFEFIIADDGSTDGSAGIIHEFAARDVRIRPLFLEHGGRGYAANAAASLAQGALIARMDSDDIALPERFAIQLAWMKQNATDICGTCAKQFYEGHNLWWFPETNEAIRHEMLFRCALLQPTVLMRAEIAKSHTYNEQCSFEDYELWTRLALKYRMYNIPQVLLKYRAHPAQSHTMEDTAHQEDARRYRHRYFNGLFPEATPRDHTVFARLADRKSFSSIGELEQAGMWLMRLADIPDTFLRQQMADRWLATCQRSARLGPECFRLYRQVIPQLSKISDERVFLLWLLCALRIRSNSRLYKTIASLKRSVTIHKGFKT
jgi:glycosyltransferase involved in cell wall biosynthesis